MSDGDTAGRPADQFVAASVDILDIITGSIGHKTRNVICDFVATVDDLENSASSQLSAAQVQLRQLEGDLDSAQQALVDKQEQLKECATESDAALVSVRLAAGTASDALNTILRYKDPAEEARAKYTQEMARRNDAFERELRRDHEQFTRMHAQRLAKAYE
ncbi:hypothetical protein IWW52_004693, partial [Coemansia sp. RSA 2704]